MWCNDQIEPIQPPRDVVRFLEAAEQSCTAHTPAEWNIVKHAAHKLANALLFEDTWGAYSRNDLTQKNALTHAPPLHSLYRPR
jgi:hypothetical protein